MVKRKIKKKAKKKMKSKKKEIVISTMLRSIFGRYEENITKAT